MGKALYRKYRSKSLDEVVGQEHITSTLKKAIDDGRISHAYLFTGPRGVGKTSVARILAHEINNLPYDDDAAHLDIVEIDAASNRRIDEIRDLREKVHIAPSSALYKVYIVDEVHMLTREAFNALLKTLEEPPAHAVFILATSEPHKVPATIVSRTQRFSFRPIAIKDALTHLRTIADKEKVQVSDEALTILAKHADGSFRDSIGLLDQLRGHNSVDANMVRDLIGVPPDTAIHDLVSAISAQSVADVLTGLETLRDQGFTAGAVASAISKRYRQVVQEQGRLTTAQMTLLKNLLHVPSNPQPTELLEILLLEAAHNQTEPSNSLRAKAANTTPEPSLKENPVAKKVDRKTPSSSDKTSPELSTDIQNTHSATLTEVQVQQWPDVLKAIQAESPALYRALRIAVPEVINGELNLYFEFPLHQKKVDEAKNKAQLMATLHTIGLKAQTVKCRTDKSRFVNNSPPPIAFNTAPTVAHIEDQSPTLTSISNIFGATELLES